MKIAILTPGGVHRSGTERVIPCLLWLIERLVRAGDEVHIFAFGQETTPGSWPLFGATVHNAGSRRSYRTLLSALRDEHRRGRFDMLHAFWAVPSGFVGALASLLLGVPMILTLPGQDIAHLGQGPDRARATLAARLKLRVALWAASAITVPSIAMNRQAAAAGIAAEPVTLGVALDRWPPRGPHRRDEATPIRLLHVASLNAVKDQTTLLGAMIRLRDLGVPFELDIIGCDTLGGTIQRHSAAQGLTTQVRFHDALPHDRLRPWFERADLLVMSSRREAGPIVALEAAIVGVPTVGTAVGHIADYAPDAACAVPVGDAVALADAIVRLSEDESRRMGLARAAQDRALGEDADFTAARFRALYAGAAKPCPREAPATRHRAIAGGVA
ncbi:MAG: glycosyltransferase family 4 protein [Sphingomonas sp.]|jgi:glycosyltransferase involved in cell wall biosynthesis|uniref:glycosyltransferase family 4 protein n=1 Tax=Sphingomonas sp. TaxID=28214 RepID=UPI00356526E0